MPEEKKMRREKLAVFQADRGASKRRANMNNKASRPNWLVLYLAMGLFLPLFYLEAKMPMSKTGHILTEIGLVLLIYGLVSWWLMANESGLIREDWEKSNHHDREISARSNPYSSNRPVTVSKNGANLGRSASTIAGWAVPAWLSAVWSYWVDWVHRLL